MADHSRRRVILTTGLFGASSLGNLATSLLRAKLCAMLLGPAGFALVGLLGSLLQAASTLFGLGLRSGGVRELASAQDKTRGGTVRTALVAAHALLGTAAALVLWLLREPLSFWLFRTGEHAGLVACVGIGVLLTLIAGANTAILQGRGDVKRLAASATTSTFFGSALAVAALYVFGIEGIALFVVSVPLMAAVVSTMYARHADLPLRRDAREVRAALARMLPLGLVFMIAATLPIVVKLALVATVFRDIGSANAGFVQVAWTVSIQYVGLVLSGLASDYYPRLASAAGDQGTLERLTNDQARVTMLAAAPLLLVLMTLAHFAVPALYSHEFDRAVPLVRENLLGDVFKVAAWPLGFLLLSRRRAGTFLLTQTLWLATVFAVFFSFVGTHGEAAASHAYVAACISGFLVNIVIARKVFGVAFSRANWSILATLVAAATGVWVLSGSANAASTIVALAVCGVVSVACARKLAVDLGGRSRAMRLARKLLMLPEPK